MTWVVEWDGRELDVDPWELTGLEVSLIKQRTGLTFNELIRGIPQFDGDAIRALFWAVERRGNEELKFTDYGGPSVGLVARNIAGFADACDAVGKAIPDDLKEETTETSGSPSSPRSSEPSTDPSTTG